MPLWSLPNGKTNGSRRRDLLFWRVVLLAFAVVLLYGVGMGVVLLFGDDAVGLRMLNIFPPLLSSVLSLSAGYLLGHASVGYCDCPSCQEARIKAAERELADDGPTQVEP